MGTDFFDDGRGAPPDSWVNPFCKALALRGRPESKTKWYLVWARQFATCLSDRPLHLATRDDADRFLTTLASTPRISAWQVEQATDALTILLGGVFGQEWARTIRIPASPPPPDVPLPRGDDPIEQLRYAIRCRRYSARTEESYVFWVSRFLDFCREGGIGKDGDSVRAFLEHLVMEDQMSSSTQGLALNASSFTSSMSSGRRSAISGSFSGRSGRGNSPSFSAARRSDGCWMLSRLHIDSRRHFCTAADFGSWRRCGCG